MRHLTIPLLLLASCASFDRNAPVAVLGAPQAPVRGDIDLDIDVSDARPGIAEMWIRIDDGPEQKLDVFTDRWRIDTSTLADGPHTAVLRAVDSSFRGNETQREVSFVSDNSPPVLQISERSLEAHQAMTWPIVVRVDEQVTRLTVKHGDVTTEMFPLGDNIWRSLRSLEFEHPEGYETIEFDVADVTGNEATYTVPVRIVAQEWPRGGYIRLSYEQRKARLDMTAVDQMKSERAGAYETAVADQLWDGVFAIPVEGRLTSPFGKYRTYSDGKRSFHSGTDLGAATGTPVYAAANGVVTLAKSQAIFGNVVIVGHGQGVSTSYNHLSAIEVELGATVKQGDLLGRVGSTGQSTGPHLHWGLTIESVIAADPTEWLKEDFSVFDTFVDLPSDNESGDGGAMVQSP